MLSKINIFLILGVIILAGAAGYFVVRQRMPLQKPTVTICAQDAKQCPDGNYVGRQGPDCTFSACPNTPPPSNLSCKSNADCANGFLCHANVCAAPIGRQCNGSDDTSCPADYECVQSCGPPIVRYPNESPPGYVCQIKGYVRSCPICLAKNTLIDTPSGAIAVQNLQKGEEIWTVNSSGARVRAKILETSRTSVPITHRVIHLVLDDGRQLLASPGHPAGDGRTIGDLSAGDVFDGARVKTTKLIPYQESFTYDILPSGDTGLYWANAILIGSTLFNK